MRTLKVMGARGGTPHGDRPVRPVALIVLGCGLLALGVVFLVVRPANFVDLHIYLVGGEAVLRGDDVYAVRGETGGWFTYPPFAALLFAPLALLPTAVAEVLWTAGVALCAALIVRPVLPSRTVTAVVVALVLPFASVMFNLLQFGQIGALLTLLVLLDVVALQRGARYAGLLTGVAAAIKLTPALFLVWMFLLGRRAAALRGTAAFLGTALAGAAVLPAASQRYWTSALWQTDRVGQVEAIRNQSLYGVALRAGLDQAVVLVVLAAAAVAGVLAAAYTARRAGLLWGALLAGCVMVLSTPIAWSHHHTWPLLAAIALVGTDRRSLRALGVAVLAVQLNAHHLLGSSWAVDNACVLSLSALVVTLPIAAGALALDRTVPSMAGLVRKAVKLRWAPTLVDPAVLGVFRIDVQSCGIIAAGLGRVALGPHLAV